MRRKQETAFPVHVLNFGCDVYSLWVFVSAKCQALRGHRLHRRSARLFCPRFKDLRKPKKLPLLPLKSTPPPWFVAFMKTMQWIWYKNLAFLNIRSKTGKAVILIWNSVSRRVSFFFKQMTIVYSAVNYTEGPSESFTRTIPFGFETASFGNGPVIRSRLMEAIVISVKHFKDADWEGNCSRYE
jgi:hypothetical protein